MTLASTPSAPTSAVHAGHRPLVALAGGLALTHAAAAAWLAGFPAQAVPLLLCVGIWALHARRLASVDRGEAAAKAPGVLDFALSTGPFLAFGASALLVPRLYGWWTQVDRPLAIQLAPLLGLAFFGLPLFFAFAAARDATAAPSATVLRMMRAHAAVTLLASLLWLVPMLAPAGWAAVPASPLLPGVPAAAFRAGFLAVTLASALLSAGVLVLAHHRVARAA